MKFTFSWLKDHLDTTASLDTVCETLTKIGLEVEEVVDHAKLLAPFTVALIEATEQHPDADRLKVCRVNTGTETLQIVCGAPNARAGIKVVLSRPGDFIPGLNLTLGKSKIRGIESQGMLCAADELSIGSNHDGIIELPADAKVGTPVAALLGADDAVIEINLTPNRGDCAGVRGIARDLTATGLGALKPLKETKVKSGGASPLKVTIENTTDCPAIVFRLIKGVKNGPSPEWLQQRLKALGQQPISALVDITNYFAFDRCRPLHVFDAAKISGTTLNLRRAHPGETMMALNNKEYTLTPDMLVIADDKNVESIAGIMGGLPSGCSETTTDVILEVALFDTLRVATGGRLLGITSDARYRFERGLDPAALLDNAEAATAMILELCGGTAMDITLGGSIPVARSEIIYRPARVAEMTGVDVPAARQNTIFTALGCDVHTHGDHAHITAPTWRADLTQEADLVEEIIRIHGYDTIPATPLPDQSMQRAITPAQQRRQAARRALGNRGMMECVSMSFMPKALAAEFNQINPALTIVNPISADLDQMRPSILGNLLQAAARNHAYGMPRVALFEVGPVFTGIDASKGQEMVATGLMAGAPAKHWQASAKTPDVFAAKAHALAVLAQLGLNADNMPVASDTPHYYHPSQSGVIRMGTDIIAAFGTIHPAVCVSAGLDSDAVGFEVFIDRLPAAKNKGHAKPLLKLPPLQPVRRDFAFVVDSNMPAEKLVRAVKQTDRAVITDVEVFDVYQGDKLPTGKKSIAIAVTLQPQGEKAFTDADLEKMSNSIVASAAKAAGAVLR